MPDNKTPSISARINFVDDLMDITAAKSLANRYNKANVSKGLMAAQSARAQGYRPMTMHVEPASVKSIFNYIEELDKGQKRVVHGGYSGGIAGGGAGLLAGKLLASRLGARGVKGAALVGALGVLGGAGAAYGGRSLANLYSQKKINQAAERVQKGGFLLT